jgi:hypothetical protein
MEFVEFPKIPRLSRECVVTEKIDGTNGVIYIGEDGEFLVGSRTRWITPMQDNHGFAGWAYMHKDELMTLGPGWHHGEWWGQGIQRKYGLAEKRWSLFNTSRWTPETPPPACCHVVPVIYKGLFDTGVVDGILMDMREHGSMAAPGFMQPEGVVIYHIAGNLYFKKTIEKDEEPKGGWKHGG